MLVHYFSIYFQLPKNHRLNDEDDDDADERHLKYISIVDLNWLRYQFVDSCFRIIINEHSFRACQEQQ